MHEQHVEQMAGGHGPVRAYRRYALIRIMINESPADEQRLVLARCHFRQSTDATVFLTALRSTGRLFCEIIILDPLQSKCGAVRGRLHL